MYIACPPGLSPDYWAGSKLAEGVERKMEIHLQTKEAIYPIFDAILNSVNDECALLQTANESSDSNVSKAFGIFKSNVGIRIHTDKDMAPYLRNYLEGRRDQLLSITTSHQERESIRDMHNKVLNFMNEKIIFDDNPSQREVVFSNGEIEQIAHGNKVFWISSDETTHIYQVNNTAYVVDSGNPATPILLQKLIAEGTTKEIVFLQTHFHNDHTNYLMKALEMTRLHKDLNIKLIYPAECFGQFRGFFLGNPNLNLNAPNFRSIKIEDTGVSYVMNENNFTEAAFIDIDNTHTEKISENKPDKPSSINNKFDQSTIKITKSPEGLKHFITSRGFVHKIAKPGDGYLLRMFSGDINPQPFGQTNEEITTLVKEYIKSMYDLGKSMLHSDENYSNVELFFDIGHFANLDTEGQLGKEITDYASKISDGKMSVKLEHKKNYDGFNSEMS